METQTKPDLKEQHRALTLQSEQLETRWRALQSEIERLTTDSPRVEALYAEQKPIGDKLWETERNLHKIRFEAAQKGVILTTSLSKEFSADDVAKIVEQVRKAPKNLRVLWNMAEAEMQIIDKNFRGAAYYDLKRRGILFDAHGDFYSPTRKYKTLLQRVYFEYVRVVYRLKIKLSAIPMRRVYKSRPYTRDVDARLIIEKS